MGRAKKEIKAVLHLPKSENTLRQFEQRLCDFYITQVEKRLQSLPKEKRQEVLDAVISSYSQ